MAEVTGFSEVAPGLTAEKLRASPVRGQEKAEVGKRSFLDVQTDFEMEVEKCDGRLEKVIKSAIYKEREEFLRPYAGIIGSARELAREIIEASGDPGEVRAGTLQKQLADPMDQTMDHFWATQYLNKEERQAARTEDAGVIVELTMRAAMANEWAANVHQIDPGFWKQNASTPEGDRFASTIIAQNEVLKSVPVELQPEIPTPVAPEPGGITLGQALIATEGVEAVADALKGDNTQAVIRELQEVARMNRETAKTMREVAEALKEKRESQSKPRPAEAKEEEKPPALEAKEKEIGTFREAMDYLSENWQAANSKSLPEVDKERFAAAVRVKREATDWASKQNHFEGGKRKVAELMVELIGDDDYWNTIKSTGMPRADLGIVFVARLKSLSGDIPDASDNRAGLRDAWLDGIAREWMIAYLKAKDTAEHPGDRSGEIRELVDEKKYLGWGSVKTPATRSLIQKLAARAVSWEEQNDPALKSWTEARRQASGEVLNKIAEMRGLGASWNLEVKREKPTETDHTVISEKFVRWLGLPEVIYDIPRQVGQSTVRGFDTATLLTSLFLNGRSLPMLSYENILYTLGTGADDKAIYSAFKGIYVLQNVVIPLVIGRFKTGEGSYASLGGKDGQGGILNKGDGTLDLREIIPAIQNNEDCIRLLGILFASDGYRVKFIPYEDRKLADSFREKFATFINDGKVKEVEKGEPGLVRFQNDEGKTVWGRPALRKTPGYTQRECDAYMFNEVAEKIADQVGCDKGMAVMMVMIYTTLGGGQRVIEYREMRQRFPVLRTGQDNPKEVIMRPFLYRLKIGDGRYGFGYVENELKERGVVGMLDALMLLKDGHDLWKYWSGQGYVFELMKKVDELQKGNDEHPNEEARRAEIAKLVDPLPKVDPPLIQNDTLDLIKSMPVAEGQGKQLQAGAVERGGASLKVAREIARDIELPVFDPNFQRGLVEGLPIVGKVLDFFRRFSRKNQ